MFRPVNLPIPSRILRQQGGRGEGGRGPENQKIGAPRPGAVRQLFPPLSLPPKKKSPGGKEDRAGSPVYFPYTQARPATPPKLKARSSPCASEPPRPHLLALKQRGVGASVN